MPVGLRPLRLDDWHSVHTWAQREDVCRYQAWGPNTPDQTYVFVQAGADAWRDEPQSRFPYAVEVNGQVRGLGTLLLSAHSQGEITYSVHPGLWGQGIATLVGQQLLNIGFTELNLHRIFGTCDPRNVASGRVMTKLGMTREGRLRQNMLIRDGWRDSDLYSILDHEWENQQR